MAIFSPLATIIGVLGIPGRGDRRNRNVPRQRAGSKLPAPRSMVRDGDPGSTLLGITDVIEQRGEEKGGKEHQGRQGDTEQCRHQDKLVSAMLGDEQ